jgi:GGDEF domain-containing protein
MESTQSIRFDDHKDELTGCMTLAGMMQILNDRSMLPVAYQGRSTLVTIRLENYLRMRAEHGLSAVNLAIQEIALQAQQKLPKSSVICRMKEDAFAVLIPANLQTASSLTENLMQVLRAYHHDTESDKKAAMHLDICLADVCIKNHGT